MEVTKTKTKLYKMRHIQEIRGNHDDVIKWKHFPRYWPFVRWIHWSHWPVMWCFDVFFDLRLNNWLSKQWWDWLFEMSLPPLWRHCNVIQRIICIIHNCLYVCWVITAVGSHSLLYKIHPLHDIHVTYLGNILAMDIQFYDDNPLMTSHEMGSTK